MERFEKILVAVDFGAEDRSLLTYARRISEMARSKKVCLFHSAEEVEIPEGIQKLYPELAEPVADRAVARMKELALEAFGAEHGAELCFVVGRGEPLRGLLERIKGDGTDLVVVGRPRDGGADSAMAEKLTRKAPCSVLIVPEGAPPRFDRVLIASDLSSHSADALDVARAFVRAAGAGSLDLLHVYGVPTGYHKLGKSREEFAEIMRRHASERLREAVDGLGHDGPTPRVELALDDRPARAISRRVADGRAELLVMGARGRTAGAAVLLGSVTEKVIRAVEVPLLAVKRKGEGLDLLDAILSLKGLGER